MNASAIDTPGNQVATRAIVAGAVGGPVLTLSLALIKVGLSLSGALPLLSDEAEVLGLFWVASSVGMSWFVGSCEVAKRVSQRWRLAALFGLSLGLTSVVAGACSWGIASYLGHEHHEAWSLLVDWLRNHATLKATLLVFFNSSILMIAFGAPRVSADSPSLVFRASLGIAASLLALVANSLAYGEWHWFRVVAYSGLASGVVAGLFAGDLAIGRLRGPEPKDGSWL